ncbi:MAG: hypothetical protein H6Q20_2349 [Bacteroidetes bacterium]|nr:hypothetical protein [Bacteroidota bacterium]
MANTGYNHKYVGPLYIYDIIHFFVTEVFCSLIRFRISSINSILKSRRSSVVMICAGMSFFDLVNTLLFARTLAVLTFFGNFLVSKQKSYRGLG